MTPALLVSLLACPPVPTIGDSGSAVSDSGTRDSVDTGDPPTDSGRTDSTADPTETGDTAPPIDSALFGVDTDGDGLSDGLELQLGWDPEDPDSDDDGFTDGEEYAGGTDGLLPWSWPLDGCRWPDLRDQAQALAAKGEQGWDDRDVVPDLVLTDQCGGQVSPWNFPGHVIVVDMAATWCGPCRDAAPMLQDRFSAFRARGFVILTMLQGATPDEAQAWAAEFGSAHPVMADQDSELIDQLQERSTTYPSYVLIDANLVVRSVKVGEADQSWFDLYVPGLQDERDAGLE